MRGRRRHVVPAAQLAFDPEALGADCKRCPLKADRHGLPVPGEGPKEPLLAIVGEAPGPEEAKAGRPFIGKSGEQLESMLHRCNVQRPAVYIDNALSCLPPGVDLENYLKIAKRAAKADGIEFVSPIDCCRPRLLRALGIPRCSKCERFRLGIDRCACAHPRWVVWSHRTCPNVIMPVGNAALMSLLGVKGIKKRRGSPLLA